MQQIIVCKSEIRALHAIMYLYSIILDQSSFPIRMWMCTVHKQLVHNLLVLILQCSLQCGFTMKFSSIDICDLYKQHADNLLMPIA